MWVDEGSAVDLTAFSKDECYVVNYGNDIYRYNGNIFGNIPGKAKDIAVWADGTVWVIGTDIESGGYSIFRLKDDNTLEKINGSALRIAVGPDGNAWVVNNKNNIFSYNGNGWNLLDGKALDIGVAMD